MAAFVEPFIAALIARLRDDDAVAALVGDKVYDIVPGVAETPMATIKPPWIYIGPLAAPRFQNDCFRGWQPRIRLFCASTAFSRGEAWHMADAVDAALDGQTLDLAPDYSMSSPLEAAESGDVIDPTKPRIAFADFQCVIFRAQPLATSD